MVTCPLRLRLAGLDAKASSVSDLHGLSWEHEVLGLSPGREFGVGSFIQKLFLKRLPSVLP